MISILRPLGFDSVGFMTFGAAKQVRLSGKITMFRMTACPTMLLRFERNCIAPRLLSSRQVNLWVFVDWVRLPVTVGKLATNDHHPPLPVIGYTLGIKCARGVLGVWIPD